MISNISSGSLHFNMSFGAVLDRIMRQVEYHCFADLHNGLIDPIFKELCLIISEIFFIDPDAVIKVNGSLTPVRLVQDVFTQLRNEHIRLVFSNFQDVTYRVYNKKAYLRTALYNSVFEIESYFINSAFLD